MGIFYMKTNTRGDEVPITMIDRLFRANVDDSRKLKIIT